MHDWLGALHTPPPITRSGIWHVPASDPPRSTQRRPVLTLHSTSFLQGAFAAPGPSKTAAQVSAMVRFSCADSLASANEDESVLRHVSAPFGLYEVPAGM